MAHTYEVCTLCESTGKQNNYSPTDQKKTLIISSSLFFLMIGVFYCATQLISAKTAGLPLTWHSEGATLGLIFGSSLILLGGYAHLEYALFWHWKSWLKGTCYGCFGQGYRPKNEISWFKASIYFGDIFVFEQILIPMYRALTFQFFWSAKKTLPTCLRFFFYFILFFGCIPFLVLVMGQDHLLGLILALAVTFYIIYLVCTNSDQTGEQKTLLFLLIPLYYVSMVEVFRWAWFFSMSSLSVIPDQSDFLLMGLENLIRTQLFLDIFEIYDIQIANIQGVTLLSYFAIFVTRVLLDLALISLLIKTIWSCSRRTWLYKHTGEKGSNLANSDTLVEMENQAAIGQSKNILKVQENLQSIFFVIEGVRSYIANVAQNTQDKQLKSVAEECSQLVAKIPPTKTSSSALLSDSLILWKDRVLSLACVTLWIVAFTVGIQVFIENTNQHEIRKMMVQAKDLKEDHTGRQSIYLRVLEKDSYHKKALLASSQTYLDMASLNCSFFDFEQALISVDSGFSQAMKLEKLDNKKEYSAELKVIESQAYLLRGTVFFLQNDFSRARAELRKVKTQGTRRMLCNLSLFEAAAKFPHSPLEFKGFLSQAEEELGFDPEYPCLFILQFLHALEKVFQENFREAQSELVSLWTKKTTPLLRQHLARTLGNILWREGRHRFSQAEQFLERVQKKAPFDLANLYLLQKKWDLLEQTLNKILAIHSSQSRPYIAQQVKLKQSIALLRQGKKHESQALLPEIFLHRSIDKFFQDTLLQLWKGEIDPEGVLEICESWNLDKEKSQKSLAHYYIGEKFFAEENFAQAAFHFKQNLLQGDSRSVENEQARQNLEEIEILKEDSSFLGKLFFDEIYLKKIASSIQEELREFIVPERETYEALAFILATNYTAEKLQALKAIWENQRLSRESFLPLLEQALNSKNDENESIQLVALEILAEIGPSEKLAPKVLGALGHSSEKVRRVAVKAIAQLPKNAFLGLEKALKDKDKYVRRDAGYALAKFHSELLAVLPSLEKALYDPEVIVRDAAFSTLKTLGIKALPSWKRLLEKKHPDTVLQIYAFRELKKQDPNYFQAEKKKLIPLLIDILRTDKDLQSRRWAAAELLNNEVGEDFLGQKYLTREKEEIVLRIRESLQDSDPQRQLVAATLWLECHRRWQVDLEPVLDVLYGRWKVGNAQDQNQVFLFLWQKEKTRPAVLKILSFALEHPLEKVSEKAYEFWERIIESDSFPSLSPHIWPLFFRMIEEGKLLDVVEELLALAVSYDSDTSINGILPYLLNKKSEKNKVSRVRTLVLQTLLSCEEISEYELDSSQKEALLQKWPKDSFTGTLILNLAHQTNWQDKRLLKFALKILKDGKVEEKSVAVRFLSSYPQEAPQVLPQLLLFLAGSESDENGEEDEKKDEEGENEYQEEEDEGQYDEEEDEEELSPQEELQEATLFTLGAWKGLDEIYRLGQKYPHLEILAINAILDAQIRIEAEDRETVAILAKFLSSEDEEVVLATLYELGEFEEGTELILPFLQKLEASSNEEIRTEANRLVLSLDPPSEIQDLLIYLNHPDDAEIRLEALEILSQEEEDENQVEYIAMKLGDDSSLVAEKAASILLQRKNFPLEPLKQVLRQGNEKAKIKALRLLGQAKTSVLHSNLSFLFSLLEKESSEYKQVGLEILQPVIERKDRKAFYSKVLLIAKKEKDEKTRALAWLLLYKMGSPQAWEKLIQMVEAYPQHQEDILGHLQKIAPEDTLDYLKKSLRKRYGPVKILTALKVLKNMPKAPGVIALVEEAHGDKNPQVRLAAQDVLKRWQ